MFDIGFSEILVIAIVALIVIGPERLPKVARTLGHLFGRMQRYVNDVKADISREMELEELKKLQHSIQDTARSFQQEISSTESQLNQIATTATQSLAPPDATDGVPPPSPQPQEPSSPPSATPAASQLELGLDGAHAPARKQA